MPTKPVFASCLGGLNLWVVGASGRRRDGLGGLVHMASLPSLSCLPPSSPVVVGRKERKRSLFLLNTLNEVIVRLLENYYMLL